MSNRPDPAQFAQYSYILAVVSASVIGLSFVLAILPMESVRRFGESLIWLVFLTGGVGAFLGYAAKADFRAQTAPAELVRKARIGFRTNLGALIATFLLGIMVLGASLLNR